MSKNPVKLDSLISWQDNPAPANTRGIITAHVSQPYYVEIDPRGGWVLLTLGKNDKPVFVARGQSRNVARAKQDATQAAISKLPEIKAALMPTDAKQNDAKQRVYLISARRATMRVYGICSTLILGSLWGLYWLFVARPKIALMFVMLLALGIYLSHMALSALEAANAKRDKLVKQQQARAMVAQHKQQQAGRS